jgi:hypothetical protein
MVWLSITPAEGLAFRPARFRLVHILPMEAMPLQSPACGILKRLLR